MPVALGSEVLTAGASSKGASRSCQRCWNALSGQIGRANGRPVVVVYFSPRRVYTSESFAPSGFGRTQVEDELATLIQGEDFGGVLGDCPVLYLSYTAWLGQAHDHRKLAAGLWRGDGPFRYELPNKIPVPEANSTSQMDKVGG